MAFHIPVMSAETAAHLNVKRGARYIDATLGDGGHTLNILKAGGLVLGLDYSQKSLDRAKARIHAEGFGKQFTPIKGNFKDISKLANENGFNGVMGIIYDLGYSSTQLDGDGIGLSFQESAPLDMRMSDEFGVTAADLINGLPEQALERLIREFSDERFASRIAKSIVLYRTKKKIETTDELAKLISSAVPADYERSRINPATRTFQALRIVVNDELRNLHESLPQAARLLLPKGRLIVISFHSLEDKMVKEFGQREQPEIKTLFKKPLVPTESEMKENIRSRSAKMRVFEKDTVTSR